MSMVKYHGVVRVCMSVSRDQRVLTFYARGSGHQEEWFYFLVVE